MKQAMDTTIVTTVILLICFLKYINKKHCIKAYPLQDKTFVQCATLFLS
ncbi:hypothetical protein BACSTE_01616 [Bacteroides stercoris ATCC 43183]|uniref:Uncharacterized protein n=1 Tax=Bacteroides stercoris ATCC 43183 TaxID=449673 RepID=B0NQG9_BACSE|nr:hypothetical protein BACSTE_01616 [Bacteroides stercoris ATCC 43183]